MALTPIFLPQVSREGQKSIVGGEESNRAQSLGLLKITWLRKFDFYLCGRVGEASKKHAQQATRDM